MKQIPFRAQRVDRSQTRSAHPQRRYLRCQSEFALFQVVTAYLERLSAKLGNRCCLHAEQANSECLSPSPQYMQTPCGLFDAPANQKEGWPSDLSDWKRPSDQCMVTQCCRSLARSMLLIVVEVRILPPLFMFPPFEALLPVLERSGDGFCLLGKRHHACRGDCAFPSISLNWYLLRNHLYVLMVAAIDVIWHRQ